MAIIHPSYREKRRYILVKVKDTVKFQTEFLDRFIYFFGIYGLAKAGIQFIKELCQNEYCVIRVSRKYVHYALVVLSNIEHEFIGIFPTLKKIKDIIKKSI